MLGGELRVRRRDAQAEALVSRLGGEREDLGLEGARRAIDRALQTNHRPVPFSGAHGQGVSTVDLETGVAAKTHTLAKAIQKCESD